jgi:hypothetical protein
MKRFYCTECKRIKRVRNYPSNVKNVQSTNVTERQGTCNWHYTGKQARRAS